MTSKKGYFSTYQNPNIIIDPNKSLTYPPIVKKTKVEQKTVTTNLKILQDNQMSKISREMDPCLIKNERENLNKPIKNEIYIKKASCNDISKSNIVLIEDNICSDMKHQESYKINHKNCGATKELESEYISEVTINNFTSCAKNIDLNCDKQLFQDHQFCSGTIRNLNSKKFANFDDELSNCLNTINPSSSVKTITTSSEVKTELNNYFYSDIDKSKKQENSSNNLFPKLTFCDDNKKLNNNYNVLHSIIDKNKQTANRNTSSDIVENNVKETTEKTMTEKFKKDTEKNRAQVIKNNSTKVTKCSKHKTKQAKKIKITINITYNNLHNKKNIKSNNTNVDGDLSFLDDFDVDEVVESLFNSREDNNSVVNTNTDIEEKNTQNSKTPKTPKEELPNINNNNNYSKHTSRYENKIEINKIQSNVDDKNSTECKVIANNIGPTQDEQIDCNNIPKNIDRTSESSTNSEQYTEGDSKRIKTGVCLEEKRYLDYNMNIKNKKQNIGHGILINKFVTKSDKDLACSLETRMYDTLKQKYSAIAVTHYGKFSKIFKCIDTSGNYYAVKVLDNPASNHFKEKKKQNILKDLQRDIPEENLRCIHLLQSFQVDNHMCYMTSYYPINLEQQLSERKFHIDEIQNLAKQLVEAVIILRNNNIIHHDIKPSHILLDSKAKTLKLCGFDEALYYICSGDLKANIGTINYASPEKILGHSHGFSVDIWSTALVIYEMTTNSMLFTGTTDNEILFKQMSIFGNVPEEMIKESRFQNAHFCGTTFIKRSLNMHSEMRIYNFVKRNNVHSSIIAARPAFDDQIKCEKKNIGVKLQSLSRLLDKMLIMDPRKRLTIEYVYADKFFFDKTI